jgi:hypothetical protein
MSHKSPIPWRHVLAAVGCALTLASGPGVAIAQFGVNATPAVPLPTNPQQWVNSPPLTAPMLKGKAAVLWFYEEQ